MDVYLDTYIYYCISAGDKVWSVQIDNILVIQ